MAPCGRRSSARRPAGLARKCVLAPHEPPIKPSRALGPGVTGAFRGPRGCNAPAARAGNNAPRSRARTALIVSRDYGGHCGLFAARLVFPVSVVRCGLFANQSRVRRGSYRGIVVDEFFFVFANLLSLIF